LFCVVETLAANEARAAVSRLVDTTPRLSSPLPLPPFSPSGDGPLFLFFLPAQQHKRYEVVPATVVARRADPAVFVPVSPALSPLDLSFSPPPFSVRSSVLVAPLAHP